VKISILKYFLLIHQAAARKSILMQTTRARAVNGFHLVKTRGCHIGVNILNLFNNIHDHTRRPKIIELKLIGLSQIETALELQKLQ